MKLSFRDWRSKGSEKSDERSGRMNVDEFLLFPFLLVLCHPFNLCEQRVVPAHPYIGAWMNECSELPDQDVSRLHGLSVKDLDSSSLPRAVSAVP